MRNIGRRMVASSLALVIALAVAISANSSSETSSTLSSDSISKTTRLDFFYASQDEILEEYGKCVETNAANAGEYGGVYVYDNGNAVVNVKRNSGVAVMSLNNSTVNLTSSDGTRNIIVREVKYSMAELKDAESRILELVPFVEGYIIREMGIDEEQNNIEVLIANHEDADGFLDILLEKIGLSESYAEMFQIGVFNDNDELEYLSKNIA